MRDEAQPSTSKRSYTEQDDGDHLDELPLKQLRVLIQTEQRSGSSKADVEETATEPSDEQLRVLTQPEEQQSTNFSPEPSCENFGDSDDQEGAAGLIEQENGQEHEQEGAVGVIDQDNGQEQAAAATEQHNQGRFIPCSSQLKQWVNLGYSLERTEVMLETKILTSISLYC